MKLKYLLGIMLLGVSPFAIQAGETSHVAKIVDLFKSAKNLLKDAYDFVDEQVTDRLYYPYVRKLFSQRSLQYKAGEGVLDVLVATGCVSASAYIAYQAYTAYKQNQLKKDKSKKPLVLSAASVGFLLSASYVLRNKFNILDIKKGFFSVDNYNNNN